MISNHIISESLRRIFLYLFIAVFFHERRKRIWLLLQKQRVCQRKKLFFQVWWEKQTHSLASTPCWTYRPLHLLGFWSKRSQRWTLNYQFLEKFKSQGWSGHHWNKYAPQKIIFWKFPSKSLRNNKKKKSIQSWKFCFCFQRGKLWSFGVILIIQRKWISKQINLKQKTFCWKRSGTNLSWCWWVKTDCFEVALTRKSW